MDQTDDWDDDKLADVVKKKHGSEKSNQTDIVSGFQLKLKRFTQGS